MNREEYEMERSLRIEQTMRELHEAEHDGTSVECCDVEWHTDSWFRHIATGTFSHKGGV